MPTRPKPTRTDALRLLADIQALVHPENPNPAYYLSTKDRSDGKRERGNSPKLCPDETSTARGPRGFFSSRAQPVLQVFVVGYFTKLSNSTKRQYTAANLMGQFLGTTGYFSFWGRFKIGTQPDYHVKVVC